MRNLIVLLCIVGTLTAPADAAAKLAVVTTTPDLADLARNVGGDRVEVSAMARGYQDPHFVDPKPSFIVLLRRADLLILNGLELEVGWLPPLIESARNGRIVYGADGYLDASGGIAPLEIPTGAMAELRARGDVHPSGNPHYMLDPSNAKIVAGEICERLARLDPEHAQEFRTNLAAYAAKLDSRLTEWQGRLAPYRGAKIVTYHRLWLYFERRFGLQSAAEVEPKPGIAPSPAYVAHLIRYIPESGARVLVMAPYYSDRVPRLLEKKTEIRVLVLPTMPGGMPGTDDYVAMMDCIVSKLENALAPSPGGERNDE